MPLVWGDGLDMSSLYSDIAGNDYALQLTATPERGSWVLCTLAFSLVAFARMRRRV